MSSINIFFRNDDVRNKLDDSLIRLTDLFIKRKIPICHAVEPANVGDEVVKWLIGIKEEYPNLIEIVQHGYAHKLNYKKIIWGKEKKGEFGGNRSYSDQKKEILMGKNLMDQYFRDKWFPLFTFPFGARNKASLKAVNDAGFFVINGSLGISTQQQFLYSIGRFFNRETFMGFKISYHLLHRKGTHLFQIDTSISLIDEFLDEETGAVFPSLDEIKEKTAKYLQHVNYVGIVLHHRYHDDENKIAWVGLFLDWLLSISNVRFLDQQTIYNEARK